jgi:DNA primase catalytic subunit
MKECNRSRKAASIRGLFRSYYHSEFRDANLHLDEVKFTHFRFELFSRKVRFERVRDIFKSEAELKKKICRVVPRNAYHTPVKWLNPIYVAKTKTEIDVMLSSPLFFDIDLDLSVAESFEVARDTTIDLIEFIEDKFDRIPDLIVFSGRKGFHVYYWDWDFDRLTRLLPNERIDRFTKERRNLLKKLERAGITVDPTVTADPFRLMKIPNTLHGKTGLIARPVENISAFDPSVHSIAFDKSCYSTLFDVDLHFYEVS